MALLLLLPVVVELMLERLSQADCQEQGVVMQDFPVTAEQAEGLAMGGVMPQVLVSVEVSSVAGLVARARAETASLALDLEACQEELLEKVKMTVAELLFV